MPDDNSSMLQPLGPEDWPDELSDLRDAFFGRANVYRVMAHHPRLVSAWKTLRQHVVVDTALGRTRSELAILRAATKTGSAYEWAHHIVRARTIGLSDPRIASMRGPLDGMAPEDRPIARAVDQMIDEARIAPETLRELHGSVGTEGVLDLMATVGFYSTLAFILNTFGTEIDDDIAAALREKPLTQ